MLGELTAGRVKTKKACFTLDSIPPGLLGLHLTRHGASKAPAFRDWVGGFPSRLWLIWLIGTAVASLPFLVVSFPPLDQHFFNVVRLHILADPAAFARDFVIRWDFVPDLALDLIVPNMAGFVAVEQATRRSCWSRWLC